MKRKTVFRLAGAAVLTAGAAALAKSREESRRAEEEKSFSPPGEMVEVDGKRMHVLVTAPSKPAGDGETNGSAPPVVVMLPGLGTPAPSVDFLPLAGKLAEKGFLCVSPDPFGYGFSDDTIKARTADLMIEELRTALRKLRIPAPYILLGHSVSGFYIRIWADRYPEEVCGLICEDISLPEQIGAMKGEEFLMKVRQAQELILRKASLFGLDRILVDRSSEIKRSVHNDPDLLPVMRFAARKSQFSAAIRDENGRFEEAAEQTAECALPSCPCLLFIATGKGSASQMKFSNGFSWLQAHLDLADALPNGKAVELPGIHYLHWDFADEMAEETAAFMRSQTGSD